MAAQQLTGAQRAAQRLTAKLASHPPLRQGAPSRQVMRRIARKDAKRFR